jgi:hypothetical protein
MLRVRSEYKTLSLEAGISRRGKPEGGTIHKECYRQYAPSECQREYSLCMGFRGKCNGVMAWGLGEERERYREEMPKPETYQPLEQTGQSTHKTDGMEAVLNTKRSAYCYHIIQN